MIDPALPGAVGVSHLRVYDSVAPDGLAGGTPHLHTVCTEAYLVAGGSGYVQSLSSDGYQETELEAGVISWFTPGTVHRLINEGDLEIFVLMANAGLPEAGDMFITFRPEVLDDPSAYAEAAQLSPEEQTTDGTGVAAATRRDLAVEGFGYWRSEVERDPVVGLAKLHKLAARHVGASQRWSEIVADGPQTEATRSAEMVDAILSGDHSHLGNASISSQQLDRSHRKMGCCGTLGVVLNS